MANLNARALRWTMTDAERRLWALLRRKQLQGYRFRRQHPVEPYILDFYCFAEKLAVELDGSQHASAEGLAYDGRRGALLAVQGIRVLRFPMPMCSSDRTMSWTSSRGPCRANGSDATFGAESLVAPFRRFATPPPHAFTS